MKMLPLSRRTEQWKRSAAAENLSNAAPDAFVARSTVAESPASDSHAWNASNKDGLERAATSDFIEGAAPQMLAGDATATDAADEEAPRITSRLRGLCVKDRVAEQGAST